jgi:hypothetical protein
MTRFECHTCHKHFFGILGYTGYSVAKGNGLKDFYCKKCSDERLSECVTEEHLKYEHDEQMIRANAEACSKFSRSASPDKVAVSAAVAVEEEYCKDQ